MAEELKEFYEYVSTGKASGDLTRRIDEAVDHGHRNEAWRSEYIKERQILIDAKEEGREEEKENTERERKRADDAEQRADDAEQRAEKAEAENAAYRAEIEKYREEIKKYRAAGVNI